MPPAEIVATCADRVFGIDVHPVAVALARVTWLLALGELVQDRPPTLSVPVYTHRSRELLRTITVIEFPYQEVRTLQQGRDCRFEAGAGLLDRCACKILGDQQALLVQFGAIALKKRRLSELEAKIKRTMPHDIVDPVLKPRGRSWACCP